jgi:uncharacterized protein
MNTIGAIALNKSHFLPVTRENTSSEVSRPAAEKVLHGDPAHTAWNVEERDGLYAGIWESTPGKWLVSYDEWEFCHILSGVSIIAEEGGKATRVSAGDSFLLRPGFKGTWEVLETTRKEYVIRL